MDGCQSGFDGMSQKDTEGCQRKIWWDASVKYRWKPKENMERCQREIWWNVRGEEGEMFGGMFQGA